MANLLDVNGDIVTIPDLWRARFSFNGSGDGALCVREYPDSGDLTTLKREINFRFREKIAFGLIRPGHVSIIGKTLEHGRNKRFMKEFYIGPRERHAVGTLTDIVKAFYSWIEANPERRPNRAQWVLVPNECWLEAAKIRSPRDGSLVVAHKGHHVRYELSGENFLRSSVDFLLRETMIRSATPLPETFVLCEQHHYWCPAVENLFLEYGGQFPPELILLPIGRDTLMEAGEALFVVDMPCRVPLPSSSGNSEAKPAKVPEDEKNGGADEDVQNGTPEKATFFGIIRCPGDDQYVYLRPGKNTITADGGDGGDNGEIRRSTDPKAGAGLPAGPSAAASTRKSQNTGGVIYNVTSHGTCSHWIVDFVDAVLDEVDPRLFWVAQFLADALTAAVRGQSNSTWPHMFANPGFPIEVIVNDPLGSNNGAQ